MSAAAPAPGPRTGRRAAGNAASLALASLWRIGVAFAIQVLIARRMGAASLGDYSIVLAWLYVAQIVLEAGLPALTVRQLAGRPHLRRAAHRQILHIQVLLALVAWATLIGCAALIPAMQERLTLFVIAGASLPFYAAMSAAGAIFEASERMDHVLLVDSLSNTLLLVATVLVVLEGRGIEGALAALVLAQIASAAIAAIVMRSSGTLHEPQQAHLQPWRATLRAARPYLTLSIADVLQQRADLLLLSLLVSPQIAGLYAAANSLVRILIKLAQAFWRALLPTLSRLHDAGVDGYRILGDMAQRFILGLTLPAAAVGAAVSAGVVAAIFGSAWLESAPALALLLPSAPLYAWEIRCVTALIAERQPARALWIAAAHVGLLLILLPPLALGWGAAGAGLAATIAAAAGALAGSATASATAIARADHRLAWMCAAAAGAGLIAGSAAAIGLTWWAAAAVALTFYMVSLPLTGALSRADLRQVRDSLAPHRR